MRAEKNPRCSSSLLWLPDHECPYRGVVLENGKWFCRNHVSAVVDARRAKAAADNKARAERTGALRRIAGAEYEMVEAAKSWFRDSDKEVRLMELGQRIDDLLVLEKAAGRR